jgi:hypothetical protein
VADNVSVPVATASPAVIATDDIAGVHYQKVKLAFGLADAVTLVSGTDPLPTIVSGTVTSTVSGSLTINNTTVAPVMGVASLAVDRLHEAAGNLVPKYASINAAASGDNTLVALVASKKIRVLSYRLQGAGAVTFQFKSGAGTNLTGAMSTGAAGGGGGAGFSPVGHFETAAGAALVLNLGSAVQVSGHLCYVEAT